MGQPAYDMSSEVRRRKAPQTQRKVALRVEKGGKRRLNPVQAAMQHLESKGVQWTGDVFTPVGGGRGRNFCDPDGNMLQLIERIANA